MTKVDGGLRQAARDIRHGFRLGRRPRGDDLRNAARIALVVLAIGWVVHLAISFLFWQDDRLTRYRTQAMADFSCLAMAFYILLGGFLADRRARRDGRGEPE